MAIPAYQGITGGSISSAGLAAQPWVAGHATNDLGICIQCCTDGTSGTYTNPSGFTDVTNSPSGYSTGTSSTAVQAEAWYKIATSGAESNVIGTGDLGTNYGKHLLVRGVDTSAPFNITSSGTAAAASSFSISGITTTRNNCLIIYFITSDRDASADPEISSVSNSNLTNLTTRTTIQWTTGSGLGIHVVTGELATAGSTGTLTGNFGGSSTYAWIQMAIQDVDSGAVTNAGRLALLGVGR